MITPCTVSSSAPETPSRLSSVNSASSVSAPGHRGHDRAAAAAEHDPAEHDRRDRLELEALPDLRRDAGEAAEQDAGDRGRAVPESTNASVRIVLHAHAREPRGAVVVARRRAAGARSRRA